MEGKVARSSRVRPVLGGSTSGGRALCQSPRVLRSPAVRSRRNDPLPRSEWSVNPFGTRGDAFRVRGLSRWDRDSSSRAVGSRKVVLIRCPPSFGGLPSASSGAVPLTSYVYPLTSGLRHDGSRRPTNARADGAARSRVRAAARGPVGRTDAPARRSDGSRRRRRSSTTPGDRDPRGGPSVRTAAGISRGSAGRGRGGLPRAMGGIPRGRRGAGATGSARHGSPPRRSQPRRARGAAAGDPRCPAGSAPSGRRWGCPPR